MHKNIPADWRGCTKKVLLMCHKKKYFIPGHDELNQMVETPASREKTDKERFVISLSVSIVSAIAAILAAVFAYISAVAIK